MAYIEKRFKVLGVPMIYRKRVKKSRGYCLDTDVPGTCFNALHLGKTSLYWERLTPVKPVGNTWDVQ
jgi:hypothetical protein